MSSDKFFWKTKKLQEMTDVEWEQLCDGCGQCCMHKLEDEDTGQMFMTSISCKLLDSQSCKCKNYTQRHKFVSDCIKLDYELLQTIGWLPNSCAYLKLFRGEELEWWHPLLSGSAATVHEANISAKSKISIKEDAVLDEADYINYIIGEMP